MNFNTETEGFFDVGLGKGKFRNNLVNNSYEVHFKYSIKGDRVIFELKKVSIFEGISLKLGEDTGQIGINTAKDLMNFVNLENGLKLVCAGRKLTFDASEPISRVPFSVYNWKRTN